MFDRIEIDFIHTEPKIRLYLAVLLYELKMYNSHTYSVGTCWNVNLKYTKIQTTDKVNGSTLYLAKAWIIIIHNKLN